MAIDRTGINSLEAGASSIKHEGDVRPGAAKLYAMPEEMKMLQNKYNELSNG